MKRLLYKFLPIKNIDNKCLKNNSRLARMIIRAIRIPDSLR
jgi:hypothetical protein